MSYDALVDEIVLGMSDDSGTPVVGDDDDAIDAEGVEGEDDEVFASAEEDEGEEEEEEEEGGSFEDSEEEGY